MVGWWCLVGGSVWSVWVISSVSSIRYKNRWRHAPAWHQTFISQHLIQRPSTATAVQSRHSFNWFNYMHEIRLGHYSIWANVTIYDWGLWVHLKYRSNEAYNFKAEIYQSVEFDRKAISHGVCMSDICWSVLMGCLRRRTGGQPSSYITF